MIWGNWRNLVNLCESCSSCLCSSRYIKKLKYKLACYRPSVTMWLILTSHTPNISAKRYHDQPFTLLRLTSSEQIEESTLLITFWDLIFGPWLRFKCVDFVMFRYPLLSCLKLQRQSQPLLGESPKSTATLWFCGAFWISLSNQPHIAIFAQPMVWVWDYLIVWPMEDRVNT